MKTQNQTGFTQMAQAKKPTFSMAITAPNTQQMISRALKNDKMAARFTSTLIGAVSATLRQQQLETLGDALRTLHTFFKGYAPGGIV